MRIYEILREDLQALVGLWERIHETLGDFGRGFMRLWVTLGEDS